MNYQQVHQMHQQQAIYDYPLQQSQTQQVPVQQDRQQIKQILIQSFQTLCQTSPAQSALLKCHKTIDKCQKHQQILSIFFELINQYNNQNETFTKLVITQIFTYMKKQSSFGYDNRHDRIQINNEFLNFFIESKADYKYKKMMQNTYMQFVFGTHNIKIREIVVKFVDSIYTKILSSTNNSVKILQEYNRLSSPISIMIPSNDIINEQNYNRAYSLIHILKSLLLGGNLQTELMRVILGSSFSIYYQVIVSVVKDILYAIKTKNQIIFKQKIDECAKLIQVYTIMYSKLTTGSYPELRQRILHVRQIYNVLLIAMNLSIQFNSFDIVQKLINQQQLISGNHLLQKSGKVQNIQTIQTLIKENLQQLKFQNNFINLSIQSYEQNIQNKKILFNLISIKKCCVQIFIKCIKMLAKKKDQNLKYYPYLLSISMNLWVKIKDCMLIETQRYLKFLQSKPNNNNNVSNVTNNMLEMKKQYQDLLSVCTRYLSEVVRMQPMYNLVSKYQNQIVFQLCFPWLISRQEHNKFQPQDYFYFRQDIINKQNMSYIQNSIGSLLQSYMDNIDGVITQIIINSTTLVMFYIKKLPILKQQLCNELKSSWVIEFYSPQRQIQSALTFIGLQSYLSFERKDLTILIQQWLYDNKQFFLNLQNDYRIIVQFLFIYSYFVDDFYGHSIKGITSQNQQNQVKNKGLRQFHKQVLKYCCYLMKNSYNYQKNNYQSRNSHIIYLVALDTINNSLNHTQLFYAIYCNFPIKNQIMIPNYMLPYQNYPHYPIKNFKKVQNSQSQQPDLKQSILTPMERVNKLEQQKKLDQKKLLVHYRKLGVNKAEYFDRQEMLQLFNFLLSNLTTKSNIKIMQLFIQVLVTYITDQLKTQGTVINIPIVIRQDISNALAVKIYQLMYKKPQIFPNRGLFSQKATQLIYIIHAISNDAYYIYSLGLDVLWMNQGFWNFNADQDDSNIDKLLKCTDLVVRLALKHYSSQKGVNIHQLMHKILFNFTQNCYSYIKKIHKFNILFGILLNLTLLKINPQKMFQFLYLLITQKLIKYYLKQQSNEENMYAFRIRQLMFNQLKTEQDIPYSSASDLLSLAYYLFLTNIYRSPQCLNTQKNFQLLTVFYKYLTHFTNAQNLVPQLGDNFGKLFVCVICILQQQFMANSLSRFDKNTLQFLWRNVLYSPKIYKTQLQLRVVSIKLLNLIKQIIRRNDPQFPLQRVQLMYQTACACVFYSKNRDYLMDNEDQNFNQDFDHAGQEQQWENLPITLNRNDAQNYIEDQVFILKNVSRELLESQNTQIKQWVTNLIESLPVAVRNFIKNKVINYQKDAKQAGLRKIIKVKRPQNYGGNSSKKSQILKQHIEMRNKQDDQ